MVSLPKLITKTSLLAIFIFYLSACQQANNQGDDARIKLKIATFNVSMEATNYTESATQPSAETFDISQSLPNALASGSHAQIKNIAEIIQRTRPDILLLNEFDYLENKKSGIDIFQQKYLAVSQFGLAPITYPYVYLAPVNTGVETPFQQPNSRFTHYGYGKYPGQYGMVLLSQFPIVDDEIRTFQRFLWKDMPDNLMPKDDMGDNWYNPSETDIFRLSSKSHWDIPVNICGEQFHVLASHPTPPVFDGDEDRNGRRNHDEIRFWKDYINADKSSYHYDDKGLKGGMIGQAPFVILGDLNASADEGNGHPNAMKQLFAHNRVQNDITPESLGGQLNKPDNRFSKSHTASWGMRADYVIPSIELPVIDSGVFWPAPTDNTFRLVASRSASSDHRLVWIEIDFAQTITQCR
jgi:endonuclease/exonuclease/phosphatase family metal-dependent hydrolase